MSKFIVFYINKHLWNEQFGFLPGGNNIKAVKRVVKQVLENYDRKVLSAITLLDLSSVRLQSISDHLLVGKRIFGSEIIDRVGVLNVHLMIL